MVGRKRSTLQSSNSGADFGIEADGNLSRSVRFPDDEHSVKITFSDVENVIRKFSGTKTMSIKKWITEFEQYASVFKWNELQKFIFCKRSLLGAAKLFVDCEAKPMNYYDLKQSLLREFQGKFTSAEVHTKLRERKKRNDESLQEYLYSMLDIASQAEIEESSIIAYVIDGIKDTAVNKMVLYSADSISELKEKFLVYGKI